MSSFEANLSEANKYLAKYKAAKVGHFINGEFVIPGNAAYFENASPVDQSALGQVAVGTVKDMDNACEAAERAFAEWRDLPGAKPCLLYTSPSPRDKRQSRMPSSA